MTAITLSNINKRFGEKVLFRDYSLHIEAGEFVAIKGESGAGKTTLLNIIGLLETPDSGSVTMDGQPIYENPAVKAAIGYIPDEIFYYPSATLEDMRKFYRGIYPTFDDALFDKLYDVFQLPKRTPIRRFSKGMQKQAAFHLTVCTRPKTLILDEPVTGLDPAAAQELYRTLEYLNKQEGIAIVAVTHDIRSALRYADHILHAGHGTYFFGTAAEYLASPWGKRFGGDGV